MDVSIERHIAAIVEHVVKERIQNQPLKKREPLIVANWKMNMKLKEAVQFFKSLSLDDNAQAVVCPPYPLLYPINILIQQLNSKVKLGAQNVHWEDNGAHTGEVSVEMLQEVGCHYVLVGHSETRAAGESDEDVHKKVKQTLKNGIHPIICVGESSNAFKQGRTDQVVKKQIEVALKNITDISNVIIAYEPVWAIGTGQSATPDQAEGVHQVIRQSLNNLYGRESDLIPILYGGSVNADNANSLAKKKNIDGVLVGGASLDVMIFQSIIRSFNKGMVNA